MMKYITTFIFLLSLTITFAQTTHDVTVQNFSFTPQSLTINVGDAVRWTNVSGQHNVLADDGSFTSGNPAPATWEYTFTFTAAGNNPYYCEPHGGPGGSGMSGEIIVQTPVSVEDETIVDQFQLEQNYPNPFNPSTRINYSLPGASFINLKVYDILGNEVAVLVDEEKQVGSYQIEFNASDLTGGVYFYQLKTNSFVETKKMILMK
jgi:plastocyanin